jgi:uncharacterized protein YdgA (DUF945 family)
VSLKNFRYQIVSSEQDEFINTRGKLDFAEFNYNDQHYGPMRLDVSANHLHGPTLLKLDQAISQIPFEGVDRRCCASSISTPSSAPAFRCSPTIPSW